MKESIFQKKTLNEALKMFSCSLFQALSSLKVLYVLQLSPHPFTCFFVKKEEKKYKSVKQVASKSTYKFY